MLRRWIDANNHLYIENLAVEEKQCPLFYQRFWGGVYPFLSSILFFLTKKLYRYVLFVKSTALPLEPQ